MLEMKKDAPQESDSADDSEESDSPALHLPNRQTAAMAAAQKAGRTLVAEVREEVREAVREEVREEPKRRSGALPATDDGGELESAGIETRRGKRRAAQAEPSRRREATRPVAAGDSRSKRQRAARQRGLKRTISSEPETLNF